MSTLIKWNPWKPMWPSFFDDELEFPTAFDNTGVDIYETDDSVVVEAQVPGVKEENVSVTVEGNILTISAEEKETEEKKEKKKTVYKSTRQSSFNYSTTLPRIVDATKADAEVENGVVTVTIPKTEGELPKKIKVRKKA